MKPHNPTISLLLFYGAAAIWNLTNGMMMILVPLFVPDTCDLTEESIPTRS